MGNNVPFFQNLLNFGTGLGTVSYKTIFFYLTIISCTVITTDYLVENISTIINNYNITKQNELILKQNELIFKQYCEMYNKNSKGLVYHFMLEKQRSIIPDSFEVQRYVKFDELSLNNDSKFWSLNKKDRWKYVERFSTDKKNYPDVMTPIINDLIWKGVKFKSNVEEDGWI